MRVYVCVCVYICIYKYADSYEFIQDPDPGSDPELSEKSDPGSDPKKIIPDPQHCVHLHNFQRYKVTQKSQNSRNQCFSYYFCLMTERSGSGSVPYS
jgi:hypothetical protein